VTELLIAGLMTTCTAFAAIQAGRLGEALEHPSGSLGSDLSSTAVFA
jgi:hypothetical protein